ncbi:MAG: hypothetical protein HDT06_06040, partial [Bacteroidales bacterium]|nr:hypothetical protein [Bacteroidales bacterium]
MRKILSFFFAIILSVCVMSAQHYRGFANLDASVLIGDSNHLNNDGGFMLGVSTTQGIQFNKFFVGIGTGIQIMMDIDGGLVIPLFAHFRYDFFSIR